MTPPRVSIGVLEEFEEDVSEQRLRRVAEQALAAGSAAPEAQVSVLVADDGLVRELNARHRGLDENTDVLSFSFARPGEYYGGSGAGFEPLQDFVLPPRQDHGLGDVIISYPQASRQAAQADHTVDEELAVLLVHGILHLLGHDHGEPEEEAAMKRIESQVLATL